MDVDLFLFLVGALLYFLSFVSYPVLKTSRLQTSCSTSMILTFIRRTLVGCY
jgi:hypothetical protein